MNVKKKILLAYDRINEQPIINAGAISLLEAIPVVGTFLVGWHRNIEEKKKDEAIKEILGFLEFLQDNDEKIYDIICDIFNNMDKAMEKNESILKQIMSRSFEQLKMLCEIQESISAERLENKEYRDEIMALIAEIKQCLKNDSLKPQTPIIEFSLPDYITYVEKYNNEKYGGEAKALSDYYVQQDMIRVDHAEWNLKNVDKHTNNTVFDFDDFFRDQTEYRAIIGAPFGIGKTVLSRSKASEYAYKYKHKQSNWLPILVTLRHGTTGVYEQYSLDDLLAAIQAHTENANIFVILDGLDEYADDVENLMSDIQDYRRKFPKFKKIIATSRLEARPPLSLFDRCIRLLPFSESQVNNFFKKYLGNANYSYKKFKQIGLQKDEVTNPLFCWMMAYSDLENLQNIDFQRQWSTNLQKTTLYMWFIRKLLHGKFIDEAKKTTKDWNRHYGNEKLTLRKIAAIKSVYGLKLTKQTLIQELKNCNADLCNDSAMTKIEPILTSYFYLSEKPLEYELIEFLHRSFHEYFLAEYYIECMLEAKPFRLNVGVPSEATMMFLDGLLDILITKNFRYTIFKSEFLSVFRYKDESTLQTFDSDDLEKAKELILKNAMDIIDNCNLFVMQSAISCEKWMPIKLQNNNLANMVVHQWIALFILNKFQMFNKVKKNKIEFILRATSEYIPGHMKIFNGNKDIKKYNFRNVNFSYADLSDADLSDSILEYANLNGSNFKNAILNNTKLSHGKFNDQSKNFASDLSNASLKNADISHAVLSKASLQNADLTGANLSHADLCNVNFTNVILKNTNLSNASLRSTTVRKTIFDEETNLKYCDFTNAKINSLQNFAGADTSYSKFENVRLSKNILNQLVLRNVDLQRTRYRGDFSFFNFYRLDLSGANFGKTILKSTVFSECNLSNAKFSKAKINGVKFKNVILDHAIFVEASMENIDFGNLSMKHSLLQYATLEHVNFSRTKLCHADMAGVKIVNCMPWKNCELTNVNFELADLSNQDLSNSTMASVNLRNANLDATNLSGTNLTGAKLSGKINNKGNFEVLNSNAIVNDKTIAKNIQFQYFASDKRKNIWKNIPHNSKIIIGNALGEIIARDNPELKECILI